MTMTNSEEGSGAMISGHSTFKPSFLQTCFLIKKWDGWMVICHVLQCQPPLLIASCRGCLLCRPQLSPSPSCDRKRSGVGRAYGSLFWALCALWGSSLWLMGAFLWAIFKICMPICSLEWWQFYNDGFFAFLKMQYVTLFLAEKWVATLVEANTEGCHSLMDGADVGKELVSILNFHYLISDFLFWITDLRAEC